MRWVLRLIATGEDDRCPSADLMEICRPEGLVDIANLGLTLPEAKQVLANVQRGWFPGRSTAMGRGDRVAGPAPAMPPEGLAGATASRRCSAK